MTTPDTSMPATEKELVTAWIADQLRSGNHVTASQVSDETLRRRMAALPRRRRKKVFPPGRVWSYDRIVQARQLLDSTNGEAS